MIGLRQNFPEHTIDQWKERLKKDLKADNLDALNFSDALEDISYEAYNYANSNFTPEARGYRRASNRWKNNFFIEVEDEAIANKKALQVLMQGIEALTFKISKGVDYDLLLNEIGLEYIQTTFVINSVSEIHRILSNEKLNAENCSIAFDLIANKLDENELSALVKELKSKQLKLFLVDGYSIQQTGANGIQELAFMLTTANEYLHQLIETGLTIDEASACIHFRVGLGNNYFQQIAKIRALKSLWMNLVSAYSPAHNCSKNIHVWAQTGLLNKSAKDPYTNLLRQTTETMSALNAGVDLITVLPYDVKNTEKGSLLAERMAINIPLLLEEESYLDKVIDPLGGSYAIENLTAQFISKSWSLFQSIEKLGGIGTQEGFTLLRDQIMTTATNRIDAYKSKQNTLIGVNKFPNIEDVNEEMQVNDQYLGMSFINLEMELSK